MTIETNSDSPVAVGAHEGPVVFMATRFTTGGATLNALMLAEQLIARGQPAELWCLYRAGDLATRDVPTRIFLESLPRGPFRFARMVARLRKAIGEVRPKALVSFHPLANILGALASGKRCRFVASQRNPSQSQSAPLAVLEKLIGSTALYDANIAVSGAVRQTYEHYPAAYRGRMRVIHNGLPPLAPVSDGKREAREKLGLPPSGPLVGNLGRLHHQKAPEFLLDVARTMPGVPIVLAGDGPMEAMLRREVERDALDVHFTGRLEGADITLLYRSLDLFLFPSRYEGFGRSLIEALSQGVWPIAHDMPVTREVMGPVGDFLPYDAELWAETIRRRLTEEDRADRPGEAELVARAAHFSLDAMVENYMAAIAPDGTGAML